MRKARNSKLALVLVFAMLATMFIGVGTASATCTYSTTTVPKLVANGTAQTAGSLVITLDSATFTGAVGSTVYLSLPTSPSGYNLTVGAAQVLNGTATIAGSTVSATTYGITVAGPITVTNPGFNVQIVLPLTVTVPTGVTGDIILTADAPRSSVFASGSLPIATVGEATVTLSCESTPSISSSGGNIGVINLKENSANALQNSGGTSAIKLTLPPGFKWVQPTTANVTSMWGDLAGVLTNNSFSLSNDNRELAISVAARTAATAQASFIKLALSVTVDESVAKTGDVTVKVGGATSASPSELVVAKYGEYGATVKAYSTTDIIAGKAGQDIGKLEVDEGIPGSLITGRTITLTLPDNVKWTQLPTIDLDKSTNLGSLAVNWVTVGSDAKMIKGTVAGSSTGQTSGAKIVFKNMQVTAPPDFSGDVAVTVGGSQGVAGTITLATAKPAITATASATPDVKIGLPNQSVGDITITENKAEAIVAKTTYCSYDANNLVVSNSTSGTSQLVIKAPAGVTFTSTPTVAVTDGDLQISTGGVSTGTTDAHEGLLYINIKSSSTKPSTIKISGINVTVDRTVPEGALTFKVRGTAVNDTLSSAGTDVIFPGRVNAAAVDVGKCITPAPGETKATTVLQAGSTTMKVNGADVTMDVAPYLKDSRLFVSVRFAAKGLGVDDNNILWDQATKTATLITADGRYIQMTLGSKVMTVNGAKITMDVAPEMVSNRVMLPVGWLAKALGATATWDNATSTATLEL